MSGKEANELLAIGGGTKRDRYGRYLLPDPETGQTKAWTRASTVAHTLADRFNLERWSQRNLVFGMGRREDLFAKAASVSSTDEKDALNAIVDEALEASGSASRANLGTAVHRFTERVDAGEEVEIPEQWRGDVKAYRQAMADGEIEVVPGWIERILVVPSIQTAGTCDRLLSAHGWAHPRIGDLKTGANVELGMNEIALQEAIYANATYWWDPVAKEYHKVPEVDLDWAMVMHLPVGQNRCTLIDVDIAAGWEAVELAMDVRAWRKRKDLSRPYVSAGAEGRLSERTVWARSYVEYVVEQGHGEALAAAWSTTCAHVATFRHGGPRSHAEVDAIAGACSAVARDKGLEFFNPDPTAEITKPKTNIKELLSK